MKIDLVYVDDVVEALLHGIGNKIGSGPYAVSSGKRRSFAEIIKIFEDIGGKSIDCRWGEFFLSPRTPVEPWSGPALPGWRALVDLESGITRLLNEEVC